MSQYPPNKYQLGSNSVRIWWTQRIWYQDSSNKQHIHLNITPLVVTVIFIHLSPSHFTCPGRERETETERDKDRERQRETETEREVGVGFRETARWRVRDEKCKKWNEKGWKREGGGQGEKRRVRSRKGSPTGDFILKAGWYLVLGKTNTRQLQTCSLSCEGSTRKF